MSKETQNEMTVIDINLVRREIAVAHDRIRKWEQVATEPPTPHKHWVKLGEYAGRELQKALKAGLAWIEVPLSTGMPRFVLKETRTMTLETAIETLQVMIERAQGNLIAIPEQEEIDALECAIDCVSAAIMKREKEINQAVQMIRHISGWPDKDIETVWTFLREKMNCSEETKLEIERRLGLVATEG